MGWRFESSPAHFQIQPTWALSEVGEMIDYHFAGLVIEIQYRVGA